MSITHENGVCVCEHVFSDWGEGGRSCLLLPLELSQEGSGRQEGTPVQPDPSSCPRAWWSWLTLISSAACRGSSMSFHDCHLPHCRHHSSHHSPGGSLGCPRGHWAPSDPASAPGGCSGLQGAPLNSTCVAELQELEVKGQQHQAECEVVSPGE